MNIKNSKLIILTLLKYEEKIGEAYQDFLTNQSNEALHQFRVNIRKSRTILKAFNRLFPKQHFKKIDKKLVRIAKASNKTRDLDVFLEACYKEFAPFFVQLPIEFYESLVLERRRERADLEHFLKSNFVKKAIGKYRALLYEILSLNTKEDNLLKDSKQILAQDFLEIDNLYQEFLKKEDDETLHKIRIKFKKIRYILELFKHKKRLSKYQDMLQKSKLFQESLGDYNDLSIQMKIIEVSMKDYEEKEREAFVVFINEIRTQKEVLKDKIELHLESIFRAATSL